jgi:hypothetical protein
LKSPILAKSSRNPDFEIANFGNILAKIACFFVQSKRQFWENRRFLEIANLAKIADFGAEVNGA